jgi:aminoglycoside 3-N-acetyltransferase
MAGNDVTITASDISAALHALGVDQTDALFVHSDVRSALRLEGATVNDKLETLLDGLSATVPDGVLMLPTFSYSFCRGEDFDVDSSPSTVGALSEAFRRREGVWRSADPLFSVAVLGDLPSGWEAQLREPSDTDSFGERSVFALLCELDAKILFLGADFRSCTLVHYVEQQARVPYRYTKVFRGDVTAGGRTTPVTAGFYVRRLDEDVVNELAPLREALIADGSAVTAAIDDGPKLLLTNARGVVRVARRELAANPDFLLSRGHRVAQGVA